MTNVDTLLVQVLTYLGAAEGRRLHELITGLHADFENSIKGINGLMARLAKAMPKPDEKGAA